MLEKSNNISANVSEILSKQPDARASIIGSQAYKNIKGVVQFYQTKYGVIVATSIRGLPFSNDKCKEDIFAYHIHSGNRCEGNKNDLFADAMAHYNPNNCNHPKHAGDLLPLMGNQGYAFSVFLTDRFKVRDVIGKTIIIHSGVDDFTTQPAGNSGAKIACGVIY